MAAMAIVICKFLRDMHGCSYATYTHITPQEFQNNRKFSFLLEPFLAGNHQSFLDTYSFSVIVGSYKGTFELVVFGCNSLSAIARRLINLKVTGCIFEQTIHVFEFIAF